MTIWAELRSAEVEGRSTNTTPTHADFARQDSGALQTASGRGTLTPVSLEAGAGERRKALLQQPRERSAS
jgi:hypothetical protein